MKGAPKVLRLIITFGREDDDRDLDDALEDARAALQHMGAKNVTSLGGYYLVDGQPVDEDGNHSYGSMPKRDSGLGVDTNARNHMDCTGQQCLVGSDSCPHREEEPEGPDPESDDNHDEVRGLASKVAESASGRVSMRRSKDA